MSETTNRRISFADQVTSVNGIEQLPQGTISRTSSSIQIDDATNTVWKAGRKISKVSSSNGIDTTISELVVKPVNIGRDSNIRRGSISYLKKELAIDYHSTPLDSLCIRLNTDPSKGLSSAQVKAHEAKYGKNELTPPKKEHLLITFLKTLTGGFQLLLWAGSILSFAAYIAQYLQDDNPGEDNLYMGIVLGALVILLGVFTFYQEYSSNKVMESFAKMVPSYATAIRDGKLETVNCKDLTLGDLVEVKFGDQIPADIRIIECQGFKVDNSSLTGESEPQSRSPICTHENPMETKNLAFFSTNALEGTARGIVVSIGDNTFIGRIAGLASGLDASETPLSKEVTNFVKIISIVVVFNAIAFFVISLFLGYDLINATIFLIGIIVANVPEGLLVTFTVILALTAKRMTSKNCLVKHLHAVETMGSCSVTSAFVDAKEVDAKSSIPVINDIESSVICSDKTGTLTQNVMTVAHFWAGEKIKEPSDVDTPLKTSFGFSSLCRVARLCSRAKFMETASVALRDRKINGDASETAILRSMESLFENVEKYQENYTKVFEVPFNSTNKYQYSIHDMRKTEDHRYLLVIKGAPERIINYCRTVIINDEEIEFSEDLKLKFNSVYENLGSLGERVIGFADFRLPLEDYPVGFTFTPENMETVLTNHAKLRFTGLISMIDPPRPGVADAVQTCRKAGVKVVMVTGDHPITAKAIARSVGIISEGNETIEELAKRKGVNLWNVSEYDKLYSIKAAVVTGESLSDMSSDELDEFLWKHTEVVFARVSPQQKLIIVESFQRQKYTVAVTGDGVNDSPALKRANIGIAMGISGSDVSKQAADLILLDDNFATIVCGIEEGRLIFDNLKKCIRYLLCANTAFLTPFCIGLIALRMPLPMGTIPMLMICLGTDIMPTISLSYEPPEGDIMTKAPRDPEKDKLVTDKLISCAYGQLGMIEACAGFYVYFITMGQNGFYPQDLIGASDIWYNEAINDMVDSYGQEWSFAARRELEHTCWTGFFVAVVVCQCGNVLISKTRRVSLFTKLFDNKVIFFAIAFMLALACFLSYTPGMSIALGMVPVSYQSWLAGLPFMVLIIVYDEGRRYVIRSFNWPWFREEFFY